MKIPNKKAFEAGLDSGSTFLTIDEGDNIIRLLSDMYGVREHRVKIDGQIRMFVCPFEQSRWRSAIEDSQVADHPNCPICEKGHRVRTSYIAIAMNVNSGEIGVLKKGPTVFRPIMELQEDPNWGDPKQYDINIKATGKNLERKYSILPTPKDKSTAISDEKQIEIDRFTDKVKLEEMTTPRGDSELRKLTSGLGEYVEDNNDVPF